MREERRRQNLEEGRALAADAHAQADRVHSTFDALLVELERQPVLSATDEAFDYIADRIARLEIRVEGLRAAIAMHSRTLSEGRLSLEELRRTPPTEMIEAWHKTTARVRRLRLIGEEMERLNEEIAAAEATITELAVLRTEMLAAAQSAARRLTTTDSPAAS